MIVTFIRIFGLTYLRQRTKFCKCSERFFSRNFRRFSTRSDSTVRFNCASYISQDKIIQYLLNWIMYVFKIIEEFSNALVRGQKSDSEWNVNTLEKQQWSNVRFFLVNDMQTPSPSSPQKEPLSLFGRKWYAMFQFVSTRNSLQCWNE